MGGVCSRDRSRCSSRQILNKYDTVREMLYHRCMQGTVEKEGRDGEPVHLSNRKESLPVLFGGQKGLCRGCDC